MSSNRYPTSWAVIRRRVVKAGLIIVHGKAHQKVCHPETGRVLAIMPHGERHSRRGYSAHKDCVDRLLAAGYDIRNPS